MIGMRIGMVVMVMPVIVPVIVPVIMAMIVRMMMIMTVMVMMPLVETAGPCAEMVTEVTIFDIASRSRDTLPFDMVMVTLLRLADLILKSKNLRAIFAHCTVHVVAAFQNFTHPVC